MPDFKPEQAQAVMHEKGNILVSASAGSGKTFTMIERAKRLILDKGVKVSELLAVTFTEAAAFDMKEKLKRALAEKAVGVDKDRVIKELSEIPTADISTLHSFCGRLIRQYFFAVGVAPDFKIIDETDAAIIRAECVDSVFKEFYDGGEDGFYTLVDRHASGRSDGALKELVLSAYAFISSEATPDEFLELYKNNYSNGGFDNLLLEYKRFFNEELCSIKESLESALITFSGSDYQKSINLIKTLLFDVETLFNGDIYAIKKFENYSIRLDFERKMDETFLDAKAAVTECRDKIKKLIKRFCLHITDRETDQNKFKKCLKHTESLVEIIKRFSEVYSREKSEENLLDFNDLEHFALKILSDENIRKEVSAKYKYVFVDEYQDINGVQEEIISRVCTNNLFMVGDVKQSIYGFRGCRPEIFSKKAEVMLNSGQTVVNLNNNFRSAENVIKTVNLIFNYCMTEKHFGENYKGRSELKAGGIYPEDAKGRAELHFLHKPETERTETERPRIYDILEEKGTGVDEEVMRLASLVTEIINDELTKKYYDPKDKEFKQVGYGDIAILTRNKRGKFVSELVKGLKRHNIPVTSDVKESVCDFPEIAMMVNALKAVDCLIQDIPLAALMKSPVGGFSDEDLLKIAQFYKERKCNAKSAFYDAYSLYLTDALDDLAERLKAFDAYIKELRYLSDFIGAYGVIEKLIKDKHIESFLLAERQGKSKLKRLNRFKSLAISGAERLTVKEFLYKVENAPDAFGFSECGDDSSVKVMTIHASKGLEFPVVIACGLERQTNAEDERDEVLFSRDYGFAVKFYDDEKRTKEETLLRGVIKEKMRVERMKEEMRLFYVATTRAAYSLHLTFESKEDKRRSVFVGAEKFMDYIPLHIPASEHFADGFALTDLSQGVRRVYLSDVDENIKEKIKANLSFKYKYLSDTVLPLKSNVTYATALSAEDGVYKHVLFDEECPDIEKGNTAHKVMEYFDFCSKDSLFEQVENLINAGVIERDKVDKINLNRITSALNSGVIDGIKGFKLYREKSFLAGVDGREIFGEDTDEQVVLQGIIDLLAVNGDDAWIIDYKYSSLEKESLIKKYEKQLNLYAFAVQKTLKLKVIKKVIINLFTGDFAEID